MRWIISILCTALALALLTGCGDESGTSPAIDMTVSGAPGALAGGGEPQAAAETDADGNLSHAELGERIEDAGGVIQIREKLFIAQTNDIYLNYEDYLGKTIRYEGIFLIDEWSGVGGEEYDISYVIRYGPGCCGYDGTAGFEVNYSGAWPENDAWVEVEGILTLGELNGAKVLYLEVTALTEREVRGAEYVAT